MTAYFVDSNASGANDGTTWADAYADLTTALSGKAAGDIFYCASNHAASNGTNQTFGVGATYGNPVIVISASTAAEPPTTFTRGAKESTSGAADIVLGANQGTMIFIGMDFDSADLIQQVSDSHNQFYDCKLIVSGGAASDSFQLIVADNTCYFENCEFDFGHTGQSLLCGNGTGKAVLKNCKLAATSAAITDLIAMGAGGDVEIDGFDLSAAATAVDIIQPASTTADHGSVRISGMLMPTSWSGSLTDAAPARPGTRYEAYSLDAGDGKYQTYVDDGLGTLRVDTTTVHTGTYDGTNKYSFIIANNSAIVKAAFPMQFDFASFKADANPTITVRVTSDTALDDQMCWIRVSRPNSTNEALQESQNTRDADYFLGTATTLTSGSGWTSGKTNEYEIAHTVTGGAAGTHTVTLYLAHTSDITVYVDPEVTLS